MKKLTVLVLTLCLILSSSVLAPLAQARIGIFAVSTFDTDYLLVKATDLPRALATLRAAGHVLED